MNFLLFIIAYLLFFPLSIINYCYVVWVKDKSSRGYFRTSAVNIDRFGNQEFKGVLNAALIKKNGYQFGDERETISSVLGKNHRDGTMRHAGRALVWLLNIIDKNHCQKSIKIL